NQFSGCDGFGVNPIYVAELVAAFVVVDIDQKLTLKAVDTSSLNAVALKQNGCIVSAVNMPSLLDPVDKREMLIHARHAIVQNDIGLLAHLAQNFTARKSGADSVTIGARM